MNIYKISTILLAISLIISGYFIYSLSYRVPIKDSVTDIEAPSMSNNSLIISELASAESENFRSCAMKKFKENLEVITLKQELKKDGDPLWFGGCNGEWLRPVCQLAISNMTNDKDDSFNSALNDCMVIELYNK